MYKATVKESSIELNAVEKVRAKNLTDALHIEELVNSADFDGEALPVIEPKAYQIIAVENDKVEPPKYEVLVIEDVNGTRYQTGSNAFKNAFFEIWDELKDEKGWGIKCFGMDSKNYKGKKFLTCSVVTL